MQIDVSINTVLARETLNYQLPYYMVQYVSRVVRPKS